MKLPITLFTILVSICLCLTSCQSGDSAGGNKVSVTPISVAEYDYLTKDYPLAMDKPMERGLTKEEIYNEKVATKYQDEEANFEFTAYNIKREGEAAPCAIFIAFNTNRLYTTLVGAPKRKMEKKYFCIPANKSSKALFDKHDFETQKLDFKDFEIYLSNFTKLFSKVAL